MPIIICREVLNTELVLDFDLTASVHFYTLTISVNDTENVDFITVNIQLVDINDNAPIFSVSEYVIIINEANYTFNSSVIIQVSFVQ